MLVRDERVGTIASDNQNYWLIYRDFPDGFISPIMNRHIHRNIGTQTFMLTGYVINTEWRIPKLVVAFDFNIRQAELYRGWRHMTKHIGRVKFIEPKQKLIDMMLKQLVEMRVDAMLGD